jgi:hypothetical protein
MTKNTKSGNDVAGAGSFMSTVSGPSTDTPPATLGSADPIKERLLEKMTDGQRLAQKMPSNVNKADEYGEHRVFPMLEEPLNLIRFLQQVVHQQKLLIQQRREMAYQNPAKIPRSSH